MALLTRRSLVQSLALASAASMVPHVCASNPVVGPVKFISAANVVGGGHCALGIDSGGNEVFRIATSFRGHEIVVSPDGRFAVMIGRRPGNQAIMIRLQYPFNATAFHSQPGRHFYGHGVFSGDGEYLYTTENDFAAAVGVIVRRRTENLMVESEFSSGGIGPHQLAWLSDQQTLVVANGGVVTHPNNPRNPLNSKDMRPSLSFVDSQTEKTVAIYPGNEPQSSIRHISVTDDDDVLVGMQYKGAKEDLMPLVSIFRPRTGWFVPNIPDEDLRHLKQYTLSVCTNTLGQGVITSPRGNRISFWDVKQGTYLGQTRIRDVSGVVYDPLENYFIATTGLGRTFFFDNARKSLKPIRVNKAPSILWDNHLTAV